MESLAGNFVGNGNEFSQDAAVTHDLAITADIGCGGRILRQRVQIAQSPYFFSLAGAAERLEDRNHVCRAGSVDQLDDVLKDDAMVVAVEIFLPDEVGNTIPRRVVQQQAPKHGLLCLDRVRGHAERIELWISMAFHGANYTLSFVFEKFIQAICQEFLQKEGDRKSNDRKT